jgi:hypothetical protein
VNGRAANIIGWGTAVIIGTLAIVYVAQSIAGAVSSN